MSENNKYRKYLNDRSSSPTLSSQIVDGAAKVVGAAALIGGGYSSFKYLKGKGTFDALKSGINSEGFAKGISSLRKKFDYFEAYTTGLSKTADSSGYIRMFSGKANDELKANFIESLTKAKMGDYRPISGEATQFEKIVYDLSDARRTHGEQATNTVRFNNVLEEVKSHYKNDDKAYSAIEGALRQEKHNKKLFDYNDGSAAGQAEIERILKKHNVNKDLNSGQYVTAIENLNKILPKHKMGTVKQKEEYIKKGSTKDQIKLLYQKINKQYEESLIKNLSERSLLTDGINKITGYEKLTVGEAVKRGIFKSPINYKNRPVPGKNGLNFIDMNPQSIAETLLRDVPGLSGAYVDPMVFKNKSGNIMDLRFPGRAGNQMVAALSELQAPFVNIRPFKMLSGLLGTASKQMPVRRFFRGGSVNPVINNSLSALNQDHFYFNGRVVNEKGEMVADNMQLASSKFGPYQRSLTAISGHTMNPKINDEPTSLFGKIKKWSGIGYQDFESSFARKSSAATKFWDKDWERNIINDITRPGSTSSTSKPYLQQAFKKFYSTVDNNATKLDNDTLEYLSPYLGGVLEDKTLNNLVNGTQRESTMSAIHELIQKESGGNNVELLYGNQLKDLLRQFTRDPDSFNTPVRTYRKAQNIATPDIMEAVSPNSTELLTKMDEAEKLLHAELLNQIERQHTTSSKVFTVGDMVNELTEQGAVGSQLDAIRKLNVHKELRKFGGKDFFPGKDIFGGSLSRFSGAMQDQAEGGIKSELKKIIYEANPLIGYGPGQQYDTAFTGTDYIVVNKHKPVVASTLKAINQSMTRGEDFLDVVKAGYSSLVDTTVHQLGFGGSKRAGRNNLDQVTTSTMLSHYFFFRLNEGLSKVGLGLSYKDMGSAQDVALNLGLKRILAPLAGWSLLSYANDEAGNVTGEKPTQSVAHSYANITVGVQAVKEVTGLNALGKRMSLVLPGLNRVGETPLGLGLKFGTFGIIGETKSPGEMVDYYRDGKDPIRKGRFWSIGSSTPEYGDKIKYYQPNWYRRQQSDYMMTDVMYGSTGEYWANHWLPNPRNPLGIANPLTWNHWNNKHYNDRPYPTSNTMLDNIPIVGPALDGTIGRIFDPVRRRAGLQRAHREYMRDINDQIKYYVDQAAGSGYQYMTPGGRLTAAQVNGSTGDGGEGFGEYGSAYSLTGFTTENMGYGVVAPVAPVLGEDGGVQVIDPRRGFSPQQSGQYISREQLASSNRNIISRANIRPINIQNIQSLRDNAVVDSLDEAVDPNSIGYRLGKTYYSVTEIGGIYGFLTTSMLGDFTPRVALASSGRMTGLERRFWDSEMGGLGGEISEIYRRFLPHRRKDITEYNPFKNTMPSWLPGQEYFVDFKHGDPYAKIEKGEMRLPGAGYESLNLLHPDQVFGRYGALDRLKITADVAPYSDQYRYYSSVVSRMHTAGLIGDKDFEQVALIKDQVKNQKLKYDLHPYKFKYARVNKEEVTILRMLDSDTFLTKEHPNAPIRLAGIKMPALGDDSDEANEARAYLEQFIAPGKKIKIGIDADALNRTAADTMGTMRAAVYDAAGDPLNARMARKFKNVIKADFDDTSSTATHALFESKEITIGKLWESFAHQDTFFHTKFLQIRSPLEMYKRKELYGKSWQSWSHPIRDFITPTVESFWTANPLVSTAMGGAMGWLMGFSRKGKKITTAVGALIGGLGSSARTIGEMAKRDIFMNEDATWIPARRRKQREIDEYFDMLKYVKYKGLYERARRLATKYEGMDPEDVANASEEAGSTTSFMRRKLNNAKKWMKINMNNPLVDPNTMKSRLDAVNAALTGIDGNRKLIGSGPYTLRALQYRQQYKSTLYGAEPNGDLMDIYRALPKKDKPFFKEFMLAGPEEREEILRLVPKNQRRFYQAKWGLKVDKQESLESYFSKHRLPGPEWAGWKPEFSMDEIKLKFVESKGLEIGEFGYWEDDLRQVKNAPILPSMSGAGIIDLVGLRKALEGAGVKDSDIKIEIDDNLPEAPADAYNVSVNMKQDRRQDINKAINDNMSYLLT